MRCENCDNQNDNIYGSGRFCSKKCACAFSTKSKRKEINEKVSHRLKGVKRGETPAHVKKLLRKVRISRFELALELLAWDEYTDGMRRRSLEREQNGKCNGCGLIDWRNKEIKLQLEHKDGNRYNNERNNLELLCPNCHSQTQFWCGKNCGRYPKPSDEEFVEALRAATSIRQACLSLKLSNGSKNYNRAYKLITEYDISHLK